MLFYSAALMVACATEPKSGSPWTHHTQTWVSMRITLPPNSPHRQARSDSYSGSQDPEEGSLLGAKVRVACFRYRAATLRFPQGPKYVCCAER